MDSFYTLPEYIRTELQIDPDGKVWASARATSRLAGVSSSALSDTRHGLLTRLKLAATDPVVANRLELCFKPFIGFDFGVIARIPDTLVYAIVSYFAWEARNPSEQAKRVALAMGAVGVRTYFQHDLGWQQPQNDSGLRDAINQVLENQSIINQKIDIRLEAERHYKGVSHIIDNLLALVKLLPPVGLKEPFTAKEYALLVKNVKLTRSENVSLGRFAVDAFTAINYGRPARNRAANRIVYYHRDLQAWSVVFDTWVNLKYGKQAVAG